MASQTAAAAAAAAAANAFAPLTCAVGTVAIGGVVIAEPTLIPCCVLAALVGVYGFRRVRATGAYGARTTSISFLMFAFMMTSAMLVHSAPVASPVLKALLGLVDVTLTSSIAVSFLFDGLVDLGLMGDCTRGAVRTMVASYVGIALIYSMAVVDPAALSAIFAVMYMGVVSVCCAAYLVLEAVFLARHPACRRGLVWIVLGGVTGAIGLAAVAVAPFDLWLCEKLTAYLSGDFWWFLLSDVAMFCLVRFYVASRGATPARAASKDELDFVTLRATPYDDAGK